MNTKEDKARQRRLVAHRKRIEREERKIEREREREQERQNRNKQAPVGQFKKAKTDEEKRAALIAQLDETKIGDAFILSQLDGLFTGCTSCKSSIRFVMNRWDISEEPEALMPKIDRAAQTIYKKQPAQSQMHITVKDVAVEIIKHIQQFKKDNPVTLESTDEQAQQATKDRTATVDATGLRSIELTPAQRT